MSIMTDPTHVFAFEKKVNNIPLGMHSTIDR